MFNSFKCYALFVLTAGDVEDLNFYIKGDCMRVQFLIKKWTQYYSSVNSLNGALYKPELWQCATYTFFNNK